MYIVSLDIKYIAAYIRYTFKMIIHNQRAIYCETRN